METTPAVLIQGLRKNYRGVPAVDGVDLRIERGEVFALLGPNGAGKTSTIEILEGRRTRSGGEVSVLGADPAQADRRWRSRIGIVPQSGADGAELTVREAIRHFAAYYPRPADPDEVIDSVGLTEKATSRLRQLSGGQRRRVDVALGIVGKPELLFLDEPTTGFDPASRRQFWQLIKGLAGGGTTILLTTHYLEEAEALADRVGVIAAGKVRAVAPPADLGGRASALATVTWQEGGVRRSLETAAPTKTVVGLAARAGGEVPHLSVTRPTLEDIYLRMIGADPASGPATSGEQP